MTDPDELIDTPREIAPLPSPTTLAAPRLT